MIYPRNEQEGSFRVMCIVMEGRKLGDCDLILNNSPVLLPTPCSPWLAIASLELSKADSAFREPFLLPTCPVLHL